MAIAAIIIMALVALSLLVSCKTTHEVTEVYLHDTLRVHTADTIYQRVVTHHTDTVRDKEVIRIVLRESGDTIKVYNDHYIYRYVERNDSTGIYKTRVDSLLKVLDQRKSEKQVKTKPPIAWWEYVLFVAILLSVSIWVLRSKTFFKD